MVAITTLDSEWITPIAIVDGSLPSSKISNSIIDNYRKSGGLIPITQQHELNDNFRAFEATSRLCNDLEGRIFNKKDDNGNYLPQNHIHHYIIYQYNCKETPKLKMPLNDLFSKVSHALKIKPSKDYCINIFADSDVFGNFERLQRYVFNWQSITQFNSTEIKDFKNISLYEDICYDIFNDVHENIRDPIGSKLDKQINQDGHKFCGLKITS